MTTTMPTPPTETDEHDTPEPRATLTITHTHAEGTIIHGTAKGDGSAEILRAQRWRWGRSITAWYRPHSRDHLPDLYRIEQTANALRTAGFTLELDVDHTHRPTAEVEADKAERAAARADALDAKADRKADAASAADAAHERAAAALPEGGEPIKIGHHSEHRHRRAIEKAHTALSRSVQADKDAAEAARRAAIARDATDRRNAPVTVANRIDKIDTEIRGIKRKFARLDSYEQNTEQRAAYRQKLTGMLAEHEDQRAYWQAVRAQQIADGLTIDARPDNIRKGDLVKTRHGWDVVVKVNPKTVEVAPAHIGFTLNYRYGEITGHRPAPTT
ncbi:DUF3560 domain-containing protein [Leifsonia sp. McL0607]|uniref:DUF3560 domain-containing protein n=1 Tax=Leifsonia sp. McL0607 TaxID=3415672 RepID=UPI003CF8FA78